MGDEQFMKEQIANKLEEGFITLKMKIGAIDFKTELNILQGIRKHYRSTELELRVDANGAFTKKDALSKLEQFFHSPHFLRGELRQGGAFVDFKEYPRYVYI